MCLFSSSSHNCLYPWFYLNVERSIKFFCGQSNSIDYNVLSLIKPSNSEILWTAQQQFLEADVRQKNTTVWGQRPLEAVTSSVSEIGLRAQLKLIGARHWLRSKDGIRWPPDRFTTRVSFLILPNKHTKKKNFKEFFYCFHDLSFQ